MFKKNVLKGLTYINIGGISAKLLSKLDIYNVDSELFKLFKFMLSKNKLIGVSNWCVFAVIILSISITYSNKLDNSKKGLR